MNELKLDGEEVGALTTLLENSVAELSHEIADTDRMEFRESLKARRDALRSVLAKLKETLDS